MSYPKSMMCSSVSLKIILVLIFWISSIETVWASSPDPSGERRCDTGEAAGPPYDGPTYWVYQNGSGYEINVALDGSDCVGTVVIANGVTRIGTDAFYGATYITSVDIPDTVVSIGSQAFYEATALSNVVFGSSVASIGSYAFFSTALTSVALPNSLVDIDNAAFQNVSSITSLTFGDSLETIGAYAFYNLSAVTSLNFPDSLETIGAYAFYNSGISDLYIPNSVTTIEQRAFENSVNLSRVEIGSGVTTIGMNAFSNTNLLRLGEDSQKVQTVFYCGDPVEGGFFIDWDVLNFLYDLPLDAEASADNAAPQPSCIEPAAPDLTAASTLSDNSVGLTFTAPTFTGGAKVTSYEVSIRNPTGEVVLFTQSFTPTPAIARGASSTFTVTNLTPATTYGFSLQAINALYGSYQSYLLTATTSNDAAQAAAARVAAANAEAARVAAANTEAARKAKEQKELTEILAIIPKIAELTLGLGETTKSLYSTKCVKGKKTKYVKKGAKCPKGYKKK
jgi:hypothetical protein